MTASAYGEFVASTRPIPTSNADRILGCQLLSDRKGRPEWVYLQFETADGDGRFHQVRMDFPNALFLLSCLKSMQLDTGTPFPDDPRGSRS